MKPFRNRFITLRKNLTLMACYQHCRYVLCVSHQTFLLTIQMYRTKENDLTWRHASFSISALLLLWSLSWCLIWISDCLCSMLFIVVYLRTEFHKIMENSAILTRTYFPDTLLIMFYCKKKADCFSCYRTFETRKITCKFFYEPWVHRGIP